LCHYLRMVDIHSHILYGLDDGARTLEESVAMIRLAAAAGTTDIVATPHADLHYTYQPEIVDDRIAELAAATAGAVRIHRGCDFHLYYENIQEALAHPTRFTINQKRYLLVEFSEVMILDSASEVFERMLGGGTTPVITHPERNALLARSLDQIAKWVDAGCRVQVTAHSFLGRFGRRAKAAAVRLMEQGLVHFIASDAHNTERRPPVMDDAYRYIASSYGNACAEALFVGNPSAVLTGREVDAATPQAEPGAKKWWRW
jgi:protein-tyrosine phosphatase